MVHPISHDRTEHRWLRVTTVLAFVPAFALLLPYGIMSARPLPTVGIAVMFFSAAFSTLVLGGGIRSPGTRACFDLVLAASIFTILLPSWLFLGLWDERGLLTILATYGTTPMILNFVLHIYAALHTLCTKVHITWETNSCPNCHHNILRVFRPAADPESGDKDTVQPPRAHFYDDDDEDDARVSSEFQTSGFNTPRQSEETLASSTRTSGDLL